MSAETLLASLWQMGGGEPEALQQLTFSGDTAQLPSSFAEGVRVHVAAHRQVMAAGYNCIPISRITVMVYWLSCNV